MLKFSLGLMGFESCGVHIGAGIKKSWSSRTSEPPVDDTRFKLGIIELARYLHRCIVNALEPMPF